MSTKYEPQLIWGADAIAEAINRNRHQTYRLLENGQLPAQKIGKQWVMDRLELADFVRVATIPASGMIAGLK